MRIAPPNFAYVEENIFRCGLPEPRHYNFLGSLQLRTCILLTDYPDFSFEQWLEESGVLIIRPLLPYDGRREVIPAPPLQARTFPPQGGGEGPSSAFPPPRASSAELERPLTTEAGGSVTEESERAPRSQPYPPSFPPTQKASGNIERFLHAHAKNRYPTTTGGAPGGSAEGYDYGFSGRGGPYRVENSPMTLSEAVVVELLRYLVDPLYYPVLITCARGRYRTGLVVGCLRKLQRWNMVSILEEYRRFAGDRGSTENEEFMEYFYEGQVVLDLPDGRQPTILYDI